MCFNIGVIVGPIIGGSLADPINSYPHLFGPESFFGGKAGVWWMERWPFALPNILNAIFTVTAFFGYFVWARRGTSLYTFLERIEI
jgi:MFS family permease